MKGHPGGILVYGSDNRGTPTPEFLALTIPELMEEWRALEDEKTIHHPESVFQALVDEDMRCVADRVKQLRKQKRATP